MRKHTLKNREPEVLHVTENESLEVTVEKGSECFLVLREEGRAAVGVLNAQYLFRVDENAKLNLTWVQECGETPELHQNLTIHQAEGSEVNVQSISLGSKLAKMQAETHLNGPNAKTHWRMSQIGFDQQILDNNVAVYHHHPSTESCVESFNIVGGEAKVLFDNLVKIDPAGKKSKALQTNKNLLISKRAFARSVPQLEIQTDDVECRHGSTTSTVGDDQLYYLESRGLTPDQARSMLVDGFAEPVLQSIPQLELRNEIRAKLRTRLLEEDTPWN